MSDTNILGLIIHVPLNIETNAALGIYNIGTTCQIRLSETPLDIADQYTPGYIAKNGVGSISLNADFSTGGNTIQARDVSITLVNKNMYYKTLLNLGINLTGLKVQIREYIGNTDAHDAISSDYIFTGFITDLQIDSTTITFTLKANLAEARRANLGTLITKESFPYAPDSNIGKILPVMFGNSDPVNKRFFKIPKTNAREEIQKVENFVSGGNANTDYYPPKMSKFPQSQIYYDGPPVSGNEIGINVFARIGRINIAHLKPLSYWNDKYILCVEGKEGNNGLYRKVIPNTIIPESINYWLLLDEGTEDETWTLHNISDPLPPGGVLFEVAISFILENYLPEALIGNTKATSEDQSWINVFLINSEYMASGTDIKGFCDSATGAELTSFPEIYGKSSNGIEKIFSFFCKVTDFKSKLIFNPAVFNGTPQKIKSFDIFKLVDFAPYTAPTLENYGQKSIKLLHQEIASPPSAGHLCNGLYGNAAPNDNESSSCGWISGANFPEPIVGEYPGFALATDRNSTNWTKYFLEVNGFDNVWAVFSFKLPKLPDDYKFKNVYLGVNMVIECINPLSTYEFNFDSNLEGYRIKDRNIRVLHRGYINSMVEDINFSGIIQRFNNAILNCIPNYYYSDAVPDATFDNFKDKPFYVNQQKATEITGLNNFKLKIDSKEDYDNIEEVILIVQQKRYSDDDGWQFKETITFKEMCIIFEDEFNIENEIFA